MKEECSDSEEEEDEDNGDEQEEDEDAHDEDAEEESKDLEEAKDKKMIRNHLHVIWGKSLFGRLLSQ